MKRNVYINCKLNIYTGLRLLSNKYFNFLDTSRVNRYELEKDTIIIEDGTSYGTDFNGSVSLQRRNEMFNAFKHFNINCPYTLIPENIDYLTSYIRGYINAGKNLPKEDDLVAIRTLPDSARGIGNMVVPFKKVEKLLSLITESSVEKLNAKDLRVLLEKNDFKREHYGLCYTEDDEYHLDDALLRHRIFMQEVIDVFKEYRLYWHAGMKSIDELLIVERVDYGLNVDGKLMIEKGKGTLKDFFKKEHLTSSTTADIKDTLNKVMKLFNKVRYLAGSIDLYTSCSGEVGCFEISGEFVMDGCTNDEMFHFTENLNKYVFEYKKD